jgi:hypothetical protein
MGLEDARTNRWLRYALGLAGILQYCSARIVSGRVRLLTQKTRACHSNTRPDLDRDGSSLIPTLPRPNTSLKSWEVQTMYIKRGDIDITNQERQSIIALCRG